MKNGELRLMLGSTQKLGTGANVQNKLYAVHHIDCPWRPSDIEQRDGRILRQGNDNPSVRLVRYITKGSFDSYLWQIQEQKLKFINQVITGRAITRDCEDLDETVLTAAQIKAMANGNPFVAEKMEIDNQVGTLRLLKSNWQSERVTYKRDIEVNCPNKIASSEKGITLSSEDVETYAQNKNGDFRIELKGVMYNERAKAAETLNAIKTAYEYELNQSSILDSSKHDALRKGAKIGKYRGFEIYFSKVYSYSVEVELRGKLKHKRELGDSVIGNITRIENLFEEIPKVLKNYEAQLADAQKQLEVATAEIGKPFEHEERLSTLIARQSQLNIELEYKELQNKPDGENVQAAFVKENFEKLEAFAPEMIYNNRQYMRFMSDNYSDLYLWRVDENTIKIAYYYESVKGKLRDPEMTLRVNKDDRTLIPISYHQDTMLVRQDVYNNKTGATDEKLLSELDVFINDWLTDIAQHEYELSPEKQIENDLLFLDEPKFDIEWEYDDENEDECFSVAV